MVVLKSIVSAVKVLYNKRICILNEILLNEGVECY